jgi:hypothetical protein
MNQKPTVPGREWLLTWSNVEQLMRQGNFRHPFQTGLPSVLTYSEGKLGIEVGVDHDEDASKLPVLPQALQFSLRRDRGILSVSCVDDGLQKYFYTYVCEALELIRNKKLRTVAAFEEAWTRLGELLEQDTVLSREKQLGLIGELTFLQALASLSKFGWDRALDAWHQTADAEHDFALETCDVEVKSTSKEARQHVIGSLNQLLESPPRDLYLVSYQFSAAPQHVNGSISLRDKVSQIEEALASNGELTKRLTSRLAQAGWRTDHSSHYAARFLERAAPLLIKVDGSFPRIVPATLNQISPDKLARISSVIYSVDVSGMGTELDPNTLSCIL